MLSMDLSIWMILLILGTLLFVVHLSHPTSRRFLFEGFADTLKPSVDLAKEPDFMTFYNFHTQVCTLWNDIIDEVMKNDCVETPCPPKATYIKNLMKSYNLDARKAGQPTISFINCEKQWSPTSTLAELLAGVPTNINGYKGTLQYIVNKSSAIIGQVTDAMSQIPTISSFADYQTTIDCTTDANGNSVCLDSNGNVYTEQQPSQKQGQQKQQQKQSQPQQEQIDATNQILGRCRSMNPELPELTALLNQAKKNVDQLKCLQASAKDGSLITNKNKCNPK
jgi:hypothetical protein